MAGFQKLDKKQMPQVIGLGVASAGLFGYFAFKMIAPTASAAPTSAAPAAAAPAAANTTPGMPASQTATTTTDTPAVVDAPPPTPGMRSPFVPLIPPAPAAVTPPASPATAAPAPRPVRVATANTADGGTAVPPGFGPLPPVTPTSAVTPPTVGTPGSVAPLPVAPTPAPAWTVTGVLQSGSEDVAILRNGSERAYVHPGDLVGDEFRVVDVTPLSVVLRRGDQRYTLPLGGPKTPPAPAAGSPAPVTPMAAQQPLRPTALPAPAPMQAPLPDPTRPDIPVVGHVNVMTLCRTFRTPDSRQELDQDVANFRQAVKQVPNLAPTHVILGFLCGQAGLLDEAVKNYRIGIRLAAGYSSLAPKPLALAHSGLGIALADQGHVDAALRECRIAVQMDPNTASNHNDLAEVLDYKHLPAQAIAECRRAMALKPDRKIEAAIANNLGLAYQDQNRLTDAATQFNKAIQLNPQDATVHSNLGCLLLALGNTDGAIAELREAVRLDPDNTKARKNLTDALALTGTSS